MVSPFIKSILDTDEELIAYGIVYSEDYVKENFDGAFKLFDCINAYNERKIREDYKNGTMDINHLIDPSFLVFDEHDREIVSSMFKHYFNAYKNGLFENVDYETFFKEITTLHAEEKKHNAFSSETGVMWMEQVTVGRQAIQMLYDDLLNDYTIDELSKYYVREELNKGKFVLRTDTPSFDLKCMNALEYEIFNIGELETFCYKLSNNNIYKLFNITENIEDGNALENYADDKNDERSNEY